MRRVVLALAFCAGCATTHSTVDPGPPVTAESQPAPAPAPSAEPAPEKAPASAPGTISRSELDRVLSASPGLFLQHVETTPRYKGGRFTGWKVAAFFPGDERFQTVDLHAGDVVTRVNGSTVERPEQLLEVWQRLKTDKELVVEVERDGRPRTLRWTISP